MQKIFVSLPITLQKRVVPMHLYLSILKVTNQDAGLPVLTVQKGRNPRNPDPNPWLGQSSSCLKSGKILYSVQFQIKPKQCKKGRVGHQQSKKNASKKILSILCFQQEL